MSLWGDIIGGGLSYLGSRENASASLEAAKQQSSAITSAANSAAAAAQPWAVGSLGGTAEFDSDNRINMQNLSPELAEIFQGALSRSGLWGAQAAEYGVDPFAAADQLYQQQQPYYQQGEDKLRTDLETRLLSQGRLGATGGQRQFGELEEAIGRGQMDRRNQNFGQAQSVIDSLLGRESGDIGTATGLLDIPLQLANVGRGIGGTLGGLAAAGLKTRSDSAQNLSNAFAASGTAVGDALGVAGGLFKKNF